MRSVYFAVLIAACTPSAPTKYTEITAPKPSGPRPALALTYLGVAGWQIDAGDVTILVDPYFSRPNLDGEIVSDPKAVAARAPKKANLIVIGHSHVDHLLDAPAVALVTGAQIMGSDSTVRVARAAGVPADHVIPIRGGEDFQLDGYSVRVIPSLHSMIDKHTLGAPITVVPPKTFADYQEGGTFDYLVRIADRQVLVTSTANFVERELEGVHPDIAIIATGLREEVHDYTCRLMRVLGKPPVVYTTHFDDWHGAPVDDEPSDDLKAFVAEVHSCSPATQVIIPKHFVRMAAP